jgi:oxygen-independent coproporphyrinogen-3 oxidase
MPSPLAAEYPSSPGNPVPGDGFLPDHVTDGAQARAFGLYVHVPFCAVRCGYCDFNTYAPADRPGISTDDYDRLALVELDQAADVTASAGLPERPVSTVFFGGGTPSLLHPDAFARILARTGNLWGIASDAEITIEANPDSLDGGQLSALRDAGITRFSIGMQSAKTSVLAVLDRTHTPAHSVEIVQAIRELGAQVSVDLVYGSPGETLDMWRETLLQVVDLGVDHVSAYSLVVEPGTDLARRVARGDLEVSDEDLQAEMYEVANEVLEANGLHWYEVNNWSTRPDTRSRHNLLYWHSNDWWGVGPGAHSHIGGVRWWNSKHPAAWADRLRKKTSPAMGREVLDAAARHTENVLLRLNTVEGVEIAQCSPATDHTIAQFIADGLIDGRAALQGTIVLTVRGRLMADALARQLTG